MSDSDESAVIVDAPELTEEEDNDNDGDDRDHSVVAGSRRVRPGGGNREPRFDATTAKPTVTTITTAVTAATTTAISSQPHALQIVSIGSADDAYAFRFHRENMDVILARIPSHAVVAVVSVVGAFRTGKSFLLSWMLRYLHHMQQQQQEQQQQQQPSQQGSGEGGVGSLHKHTEKGKDETPWYRRFDSLGKDGFDWKGGAERNTTGIWMWSHPHLMERPDDGSTLMAVLLVDTQGMFDHETTMALTASIFGLSTLLSSYQIYNVDKRIQEDHLQQLALFSEYARIAMDDDNDSQKFKNEGKKNDEDDMMQSDSNDDHEDAAATTSSPGSTTKKPFQRMEFLVRDWQHFDDEYDDDDNLSSNLNAMERSMQAYLEKVLAERDASDLQATREQIVRCFDTITCYGLCHPGFAVTKKKFSGDVAAMEERFLLLVDRYCRRVFDPDALQPKIIHGRTLTALELGVYVQAYADLFATGAKFPEAATLLEATSAANNTNAVHLAAAQYKEAMDRVAGPHTNNYLRAAELQEEHERRIREAVSVFKAVAVFGSKAKITTSKRQLLQQLDTQFEIYTSLNESRNPLAGLETYLIPMSVALVSMILRWITDWTCTPYSQICRATSDTLAHAYAVVFCFLLIVSLTKMKQIQNVAVRVMTALQTIFVVQQQHHHAPITAKKNKGE